MRKSSWVILAVMCILAAALVYLRIAGRPQPSDEDQIHALLAKGASAIEHKEVRSALSCISRDYSDSAGLNFEKLRFHVIEAFRVEEQYDVLLENTSIRLQGDAAFVEAQASVALVFGTKSDMIFSNPISISLREERTKRWLIIPTTSWKITSIDGIPGELTE